MYSTSLLSGNLEDPDLDGINLEDLDIDAVANCDLELDLDFDFENLEVTQQGRVEEGIKHVAGTPFQTARLAAIAFTTGSDAMFTTGKTSAVQRVLEATVSDWSHKTIARVKADNDIVNITIELSKEAIKLGGQYDKLTCRGAALLLRQTALDCVKISQTPGSDCHFLSLSRVGHRPQHQVTG